MTADEFRSWLGGFADAIGGVPSKTQWTQIKEQLETVHEKLDSITIPSIWAYTPDRESAQITANHKFYEYGAAMDAFYDGSNNGRYT